MKMLGKRKVRNSVHRSRRMPMYILAGVALALAIALVIVALLGARARGRLGAGQQSLATQIQSNLSGAVQACEQMSLPSANLEGDLLPSMRRRLFAAKELNEVMIDSYGQDSSMINVEIFDQIELALTQIERRLAEGQSTSSEQSTLSAYMAQLEADLSARFAGTELLISRGSLK